jgi:hypothetical protein
MEFVLPLPRRIGLSGLFPFRIISENVNVVETRYESSDDGSARRNTARETGEHKHRTVVERQSCLEWDSNPQS